MLRISNWTIVHWQIVNWQSSHLAKFTWGNGYLATLSHEKEPPGKLIHGNLTLATRRCRQSTTSYGHLYVCFNYLMSLYCDDHG